MADEQRPDGEPEPTLVDPFAERPRQWTPPVVPSWNTPPGWGPPPGEPLPPVTGPPAWGPPQAPGAPPSWAGPPPWAMPAPTPVWPRDSDPWAGYPLSAEERFWVPAAHWLGILTSWLGPLVVLLTVGERSGRVREHAKASLNFEITYWLAMFASALLTFVLVGYLFLAVLPIVWLVLRIVGTIEAARGRTYRYPLALRLIR